MRREVCGGCGSDGLKTFLDLGSSPLADAFPASPTEVQPRYSLEVAVCARCRLAQLLELVPDTELFGEDYGFYSSASPTLVAYHRQLAAELVGGRLRRDHDFAVEIASNDGSFLRHVADAGWRTLGVDPAPGPAQTARARGLDVLTAPFGRETAQRIVDEHGQATLIVAMNVAAHVADLDDFFAGIKLLLRRSGRAVVEVQHLLDLLLGNQIDHVYHEHRFFFSAASFGLAAARHDIAVRAVERIPAQGGSLRLTLGHGIGYGNQGAADVERMCREEEWLLDSAAYEGMQGRAGALKAKLLHLIESERDAGRRVAGYAAAAKSTTLLNFCGIGARHLDYVVDLTPGKIGRFTPGTGIPIISPEQEREQGRADTMVLLAHNYLGGVIRRERDWLAGGGQLIVPIPQPVIL